MDHFYYVWWNVQPFGLTLQHWLFPFFQVDDMFGFIGDDTGMAGDGPSAFRVSFCRFLAFTEVSLHN